MKKRIYTEQNTINDLLQDAFLKERFYKLLPDEYLYLVPECYRDDPIKTLPEKVQMPWGTPYMSDAILDAANKLYRLAMTDMNSSNCGRMRMPEIQNVWHPTRRRKK